MRDGVLHAVLRDGTGVHWCPRRKEMEKQVTIRAAKNARIVPTEGIADFW